MILTLTCWILPDICSSDGKAGRILKCCNQGVQGRISSLLGQASPRGHFVQLGQIFFLHKALEALVLMLALRAEMEGEQAESYAFALEEFKEDGSKKNPQKPSPAVIWGEGITGLSSWALSSGGMTSRSLGTVH